MKYDSRIPEMYTKDELIELNQKILDDPNWKCVSDWKRTITKVNVRGLLRSLLK